ncbi:MAG: hypothetical protein H8D23_16640 [Candidatus Brocadiales bacterium]|nr:hypothetical protein [Candidatus Brocadiales bacterium]
MSNPYKDLYHNEPIVWAVKTANSHPKLSVAQNSLIATHAIHSISRRGMNRAELRMHDEELIEMIRDGLDIEHCPTVALHHRENLAYEEFCYEEMRALQELEIERKAQSHAGAEELSQTL